MGADSERMRLIIEARETASAEIRRLRGELNQLGGAPMVKAQNEIKKLNNQINQLSGTSQKGHGIWTRFTQGISVGVLAARAAEEAVSLLRGGVDELQKAAMVAAQVRELGNVYEFVGQRAGYTVEQLEGYRSKLLESGIAQKDANQALLRALQAQIDLNDAVKLGRVAQDAAVVGLTDSSEAYTRIIDSIAKLMPRQLKELGIVVNLKRTYKEYADETDETVSSLSEAEQKQAMINEILEKGEIITGAYDEAMFNVSKRIRSLPRLYEDLQVAIGQKFNPVLEVGVAMTEELLRDLTRLADTEVDLNTDKAKEDIVELREKARLFMATVVSMGETVYDAGSVIKNAVELTMLDPLIALGKVGEAIYTALSHPFDIDAWKNAGAVIVSAKDGFVSDFGEMQTSLDRLLGDAATANLMANAEKLGDEMVKMRQQIGKAVESATDGVAIETRIMIPESIDATISDLDIMNEKVEFLGDGFVRVGEQIMSNANYMKLMGTSAIESLGAIDMSMTELQNSIVSMAMGASDGIVDAMMGARGGLKSVFAGMAKDFLRFFVQQAILSILSKFIPGITLALKIFDVPRNDKLAMEQGEHFARYFTEGAMRGMVGMAPAMAYAGGRQQGMGSGAGGAIYNIKISGNVMSDQFTERQIVPALQRLSVRNRANVELKSRNVTGNADVRLN